MGEPIHKLATRGVMLWKELDDTIFSLPKNKLQAALDAKKSYIISKLNSDFQKPWFATVNEMCIRDRSSSWPKANIPRRRRQHNKANSKLK